MRIRRNYTEVGDYRAQASVPKNRLVEKGYNPESLQNVIEQVGVIDRSSLLTEKVKNRNGGGLPSVTFITTFSTQHHQIKNISVNIGTCWAMIE